MKSKLFLFLVGLLLVFVPTNATTTKDTLRVSNLEKKVSNLELQVATLKKQMAGFQQTGTTLYTKVDSLNGAAESLNNGLAQTNTNLQNESSRLNESIKSTNSQFEETSNNIIQQIKGQAIWAVITLIVIVLVIAGIFVALYKRIKSGSTDIDKVKLAQKAIENAQTKIQEESVKLDEKLVSLLEKQVESEPKENLEKAVDHTLIKKVADEIVRIETNLSRMDATVKGHKQLSKAVERMRNNFTSKGYEIVDMLGKPYVEGTKAVVTYVTDESLKDGEKIITAVAKPQINFKGEMIQAAEITVSQNI